ncbi:MAG: PAS-domain containing protein [Halioglobus sp.]|nr:PAS-domain containing protein [Halioglobus sp.]
MLSASNLLSLALLYVCLLFLVAWYADRNTATASRLRDSRAGGVIYALTLAVYCSSWTFYGAVGSATESPWSHAPIYLGPILVFLLGWPMIKRLLAIGERHRVTSIADFISARFGKRQGLAIVVTLVASAAVLPYIALQFKALAQAWVIVGGSTEEVEAIGGDTALFTAIVLAVFTILFGTRRLNGSERHQGVMAAITVESLVKLLAFVAVAALAMAYLGRAPEAVPPSASSHALADIDMNADFVARTLISALAILCLPRQFHVMVVEAGNNPRLGIARWLFPLYLALFMVLVVPISQAGAQIFAVNDQVNPDTYVQLLPIALESNLVTIAAFIGGISAATGMVIVATVSLAIMITNEVIAPLLMRFNERSPTAVLKMGDNLRHIRQVIIACILLGAWLVTRQVMGIPWLTQIGYISFLAAAQLAPALIAGLYWRGANGSAVFFGLLAGLGLWFYCAVLPAITNEGAALLSSGPWDIDWLRPLNLFGVDAHYPLAYATTWSLGVNIAVLLAGSALLKPRASDTRQADLFIGSATGAPEQANTDFDLSLIRVSQLQALLAPFVDEQQLRRTWREFEEVNQQRLLPGDRAPRFMVSRVESVLASVIGATSANRAMTRLESSQQLAFDDLAGMVTDASRLHVFNRELLQTTVESLIQGVAVVDSELRLVAWNSRYEELFDYPPRLLYVGCPIERVYRFNAERGILSPGGPIEEEIEKRLRWMREGSSHRLERTLPNGTTIAIHGTPMPHGGFVTTYVDISDYRDVTAQLEETRIELEQKLASGSRSLSETNARLRQENRLRAQTQEQLRDAHQSKSRFMSATSHDLLQPINAARLFTTSLRNRIEPGGNRETMDVVDQIDRSLKRAEQLIEELREIARLDSGRQTPRAEHFSLDTMFRALSDEFSPPARRKGLELRIRTRDLWLHSDPSLVHRVLQNLIGNALRYTQSGGVLLSARRRGDSALVQVWDTGPGIDEQDHMRIFAEFERGQQRSGEGDIGLGLGLSIVQRICELLRLDLRLRSRVGSGSVFSVAIPLGNPVDAVPESAADGSGDMHGLQVVCLDNDPMILAGLEQLLQSFGAQVLTAADRETLVALLGDCRDADVILADFHLDHGDNGIEAVQHALSRLQLRIPCVVVSADDGEEARDLTRQAGFRFLPKPVNPARLRALILALARN